jgi:hypothetical protein
LWGPILALLYLSRSQSARRKQKFSTGRIMESLEGSQGNNSPMGGNNNGSRTSVDYIYNHNNSTEYDDSAHSGRKNQLMSSRFISHISDDGSDTVSALHSDPEVARHLALGGMLRTPQHGEDDSDHTEEFYAVTVVPGTGQNVVRTSESTVSTRASSMRLSASQQQMRLSQQRAGDNQIQPPKHPSSATTQRYVAEEPTPSSQYVHHTSPFYIPGAEHDDYEELYGSSALGQFSTTSQNDAMRIIMGAAPRRRGSGADGGPGDIHERHDSQDHDNASTMSPFSPDSSMNYLYRDTTATNLPTELFFPRLHSGDHQADFSYRGGEFHNGQYH